LKAIGSGDLHLELPNGSGKTKMVFKNAIHAPDMAYTLISISRLDEAGYSVTFNKRMCTVKSPNGKTIATIPHVDGMYKIATPVSPDIDDATRQTKLYFPEKKSKLVSSYQKDKAYINTRSESRIKTGRSDRGGEFLEKQLVNPSQDQRETKGEHTIVPGEAQSEGERDKVVQTSQKNVKPKPETSDDETSSNQGYGRGKRTRQSKRSFRNPNDGLTAAIATLHEGETCGKVDNVDYSPKHPPKTTIFVANIPWKTTQEELKEVFTEYGEAMSVRLHMKSKGRPRGFAHIEFANPEIAIATVDSASRRPICLAGRNLHVDFAIGIPDREPIRVQASEKRHDDPIVDINLLRKPDKLTSNGFLTFSPRRNQSYNNSDSDYKHRSYGLFDQNRHKYRYRRKILTENLTNRRQTGTEVMGERNNRDPIALAKDSRRFYATTKHSDLRDHFIKEAVEERSKSSTYQSSRTIADIYSQSLARSRHQKAVVKL
jgi:RNA recognition motif-containing protein